MSGEMHARGACRHSTGAADSDTATTTRYLVVFFALAALCAAWAWRTHYPPVNSTWLTVFLALFLQATPLVLLGHLIIALPWRIVPRTIPGAVAAGLLLPTCECASVPIAQGLISRGAHPRIAIAFMLAAPSINPLVLLSTWLAFNDARMVVARLLCGAGAALIVGFGWRTNLGGHAHRHTDLLDTLSFVTIGCALAATMHGLTLPTGGHMALLGLILLAMALAIVMSVCSEADAFIAAAFPFPPAAQLAFMVVGPLVDVKLIALQWGAWGGKTAFRISGLALAASLVMILVAAGLL